MNTTELDFSFPVSWAESRLTSAQKRFAENPSATHWRICVRAMLTYQQLTFALRSPTVDKDKLFAELENSTVMDWQDLICLNTLGLSCDDAISAHA